DGARARFARLVGDVDAGESFADAARHTLLALEMVAAGKAQRAFQFDKEGPRLRDAYGHDSLGTKALLARRLVEAGVTFVLVSGAWGYFDHHGDSVVWKGIEKGLQPILPPIDHTLATPVTDLEARRLLDHTLG